MFGADEMTQQMNKSASTKPHGLSSIPGNYMVEGEDLLLKIVLFLTQNSPPPNEISKTF